MIQLSAIIIVKNAASHIRPCLEALTFADEIIVLDSGSTDDTIDICRTYTEHVFSTDWPGFGPQKNRALEKARGEWVLSIDADEIVTPLLRDEIKKMIDQATADAYEIPRLSRYCGSWIRHGDWRRDRPVRLFRRGTAYFSDHLVHESLQVDGTIACLKNYLEHDAFKNFDEVIQKMNLYSSLWAEARQKKGQHATLWQAITHSLWTFVRGYFLFAGFLDGRAGLMLAFSNAQGCYYRYVKLMQRI